MPTKVDSFPSGIWLTIERGTRYNGDADRDWLLKHVGGCSMVTGEKIRSLRKMRGWSQGELAGRIGVSRQTVSKWELESAAPDAGNIAKLCTVFEISADAFLDLNQPEPVPELAAPTPAAVRPAWKKTRTVGIVLLVAGIIIIGVLVTLSRIIPSRTWVEQTYTAEDIIMLYQGGVPEPGRTVTVMQETMGFLPFLNTYTLHWLFAGGLLLVVAGICLLVKSKRVRSHTADEGRGEGND